MTKRQSLKLAAAIVIIFFVIIFLLFLTKPKPNQQPKAKQGIPVNALIATRNIYSPTITLFGVINSKNVSELSSATAAYVINVPVNEGETVKEGQLLIKLDERDASYQLDSQKANTQQIQAEIASLNLSLHQNQLLLSKREHILELSKKRLARQEKLLERMVTSSAMRDDEEQKLLNEQIKIQNLEHEISSYSHQLKLLTSRLNASLAKEKALELTIKRLTLKSPFDGTITSINVAPGEHVVPGQVLLTIYNRDKLQVIAKLPRAFESIFKTAIKTQKTITATSIEEGLELKFAYLSENIEAGELGQKAYFDILNLDKAIHNDQVLMNVNLPAQSSIAIPKDSLYKNNTIYTIRNNQLVPIKVNIIGNLNKISHNVILVNGDNLKAQEIILVTKLPNAKPGLKVYIKNEIADQVSNIKPHGSLK